MTVPSLKNISLGVIFNSPQLLEDCSKINNENIIEVVAKGILGDELEWYLPKNSETNELEALRFTSLKAILPYAEEKKLSKLKMQPLDIAFTLDVLEVVRKFKFEGLSRRPKSLALRIHLKPMCQEVLWFTVENEKIKFTPCFSNESYALSLQFNPELSEWDATTEAKVLRVGVYFINQLTKDFPEWGKTGHCMITNKRLELAHMSLCNKEAFKWLTVDKSLLPK